MRGAPLRFAHDLAIKLGVPNVRQMLKEMSAPAFRDWQLYGALAPFTEERDDIRFARLYQFLVNLQRDSKEHPQPFPIEDFILKFGDSSPPAKPVVKKQTIAEQERNIMDWIAGSNQAFLEGR